MDFDFNSSDDASHFSSEDDYDSDSDDEQERKCESCKKEKVGGWCSPCAAKLLDTALPLPIRLASCGFAFQLKMTDGREGSLQFYLEGRGGSRRVLEAWLRVMYPEENTGGMAGDLGLWVHQHQGGIQVDISQNGNKMAQRLPEAQANDVDEDDTRLNGIGSLRQLSNLCLIASSAIFGMMGLLYL